MKDSAGKSLQKIDRVVEIPYISDENVDEDPEVRVSVKDEGPIGKRMKNVVLGKGRAIVLEKVRLYVESMTKGGPVKDELETKKVEPKLAPVLTLTATSPVASKLAVAVAKKKAKKGYKTITLIEKFSCRANVMFEILIDDNRWKGLTKSNVKISKEVGGEISIFDRSITGSNLKLEEGKLFVQQ